MFFSKVNLKYVSVIFLFSVGQVYADGYCEFGGVTSGIGGDDNYYESDWDGSGQITLTEYNLNGIVFVHQSLNGTPWPYSGWGVSRNTWSLECKESSDVLIEDSYICDNGGSITGVGGDNNSYTASWDGYGVITTSEYSGSFNHFFLNGYAFPNSSWGLKVGSWDVTCQM